jgi:glycosyltransferase involved in cell wall biosynthesis
MKVLLVHNHYRTSAPSGEDAVAENERNLLEENGVVVVPYEKFNDDVDDSSFLKRIRLGLGYAWSRRTYSEVSLLIRQTHPEIAHLHSIHPQISPSVYAACQDMEVPVVHTLHNYRYVCPGALLQRDGRPCEECVGRLPFNALRYRCYRDSLAATGSIFWMISYNRLRGTFTKQVNRYIALTEFAASRLESGGLPADRIEVKPNFLSVASSVVKERQNYAVYVGRLSEEKGVKTLLTAWSSVIGLPLKVLGDGPLRAELELKARELALEVEFMGARSKEEVLSTVGNALLQIVPSEWYEGFPMVILEAYACATPVVASRIGSLAEVVHDGVTGLHFEAGNPADLARKVNTLGSNPDLASRLGMEARGLFLGKYTPEQNFKMLLGIYKRAREDFEIRRSG